MLWAVLVVLGQLLIMGTGMVAGGAHRWGFLTDMYISAVAAAPLDGFIPGKDCTIFHPG